MQTEYKIDTLDQMKINERAFDILNDVIENKIEVGGYPASNWAKHVATEEFLANLEVSN